MTSLNLWIPNPDGIAETTRASISTDIHALPLTEGRDLRLDLVCGLANWFIFLDHIPHNAVNWITPRNYGFSDAADLFVFVSGYAASIVYAKMVLERGFIVGATHLDVPQLCIILMAFLPPVLWMLLRKPALAMLGSFALYVAARQFGEMLPGWLFDAFNPNDRANLAPHRVLHFIVVAFLVTRVVPKDWCGLDWQIFKPVIKCGQQSLTVFCVGVFLSFAGHFILIISSDSLLTQVLVSAAGIAIMTLVAYTISWSKEQDESLSVPMPSEQSAVT